MVRVLDELLLLVFGTLNLTAVIVLLACDIGVVAHLALTIITIVGSTCAEDLWTGTTSRTERESS